jgi:hypothetical protein
MNAESHKDSLRLLASLIAADLRAASPLLHRPEPVPEEAPRRGRPRLAPYAVVAAQQPANLDPQSLAA